VCAITTLTTLRFEEMREDDEDDQFVVGQGEWVLDLSRLTTLRESACDRWSPTRAAQSHAQRTSKP
jgi:hypothetical protein